ncbi:MAG: hypothetical protein A2W93_03095 [Bacteroidetes bacterium GWF2_43_63]|nr:MAG: hypothetical protein A2W93_03095 [Bacteroidetes bacterium GWF2_43_63]HBG71009.1 hypothetical protein [Bacteroidales bacterium]HCB63587.1 hypothetical protein [Bacteroidales bacterium]HCY24336.1 hypothetical protein [Bacteroidales bacterium]
MEHVGHENPTSSKDRIFSENVQNVKNGTPEGLSCVGAGCGVPFGVPKLLKLVQGAALIAPKTTQAKKPLG